MSSGPLLVGHHYVVLSLARSDYESGSARIHQMSQGRVLCGTLIFIYRVTLGRHEPVCESNPRYCSLWKVVE